MQLLEDSLRNWAPKHRRSSPLFGGVADDVENLSSILSTIQAVLQDAEKKQFADKSIADWLSKLKAAAYDADDVLDEWLTDAKGHPTGISAAFSCLSQTSFRHKIAKKIRKIITKFDGIGEERFKFHLNSVVVQHQTGFQVDETRETRSLLTEELVYGRDGDREEFVHFLLNKVTCQEALSILSILGIGGLGKTTLSQLVYNDQRVVDHFDARIWVCGSDNFDPKRLSKIILESLTGNSCNLNSLDTVQQQLQENLRGKKFLLVLDDVWNED